MSGLAFLVWLGLEVLVLVVINVAAWRALNAISGTDRQSLTRSLIISRLSILLTLNACVMGSGLYWEARNILGSNSEWTMLHVLMNRSQGRAIMAASVVIAMFTPLVVLVGIMLGIIGTARGLRAKDRPATRTGLLGLGLNALLIFAACGAVALPFIPRARRSPSPTATAAEQSSDVADERRQPHRSQPPNWTDDEAVAEFAKPYEARGFQCVAKQSIRVQEVVNQPTIYICQSVVLDSGAQADIAIFRQSGRIRGTVVGDVEFYGQNLRIYGTVEGDVEFSGDWLDIDDNAVIKGNVRSIEASVIYAYGEVTGEISGNYTALHGR